MSEPKTKKTKVSPLAYLKTIKDKEKQKDGLALYKMFSEVTKEKAAMWGTSIVGFGMYHYKSERSTQEGDWPLVGFSPRAQNFSLYLHPVNISAKLLKQLGTYKASMGCLYIKRLSDVDEKILKQVIKEGLKGIKDMLQDGVRRGPVDTKKKQKP